MTKLEGISIGSNAITDLSPLKTLTQIKYLNLSKNLIVDLSPLLDAPGLDTGDTLNITGQPNLDCQTQGATIAELVKRGVTVTSDCP